MAAAIAAVLATSACSAGSSVRPPAASVPLRDRLRDGLLTQARLPHGLKLMTEQIDYGWFGQESLDRYAPGRAAAVMAAVRGVAQRCTAYTDTLVDGSRTRNTVSVTRADERADDSLVLRVASTFSGDTDPFITETGFVREGDVIIMV
ncbi:hypothetical protein AB0E70_29500 [Streptomyces murinus]|uniref:hypothetical protein n=1 Tax=Streptomyces murinus TaxID=33900 RepID=UPI00117D7541|nr:hypothetical protein [Streptomyces murinus]